jgi:2-polyprenyl-3-methyl-5-hydroxy-6-metoxy-1,4-benzoquinol methylase
MFCEHTENKTILKINNVIFLQCLICNIVYAENNNKSFFSKNYDDYYQNTGARFNFGVELIVKAFRFVRALKIFLLNPNAQSILDIGSGRGWMLYFLKKYFSFKTAIGTQISMNAYKFSRDTLKLEIYNQDLLAIDLKKYFDTITLWHVLEHVPNPEAYLQKIHTLLNKQGILVIEVPNHASWSRKLTKHHWLSWDTKHHLTFFTPATLTRLLKYYDYQIIRVRTFSLEYSTFTSVQSIINLITNTENYFFQALQNKNLNLTTCFHFFLFILLFLPSYLVNLALYFSKSGEVINIIAKKNA